MHSRRLHGQREVSGRTQCNADNEQKYLSIAGHYMYVVHRGDTGQDVISKANHSQREIVGPSRQPQAGSDPLKIRSFSLDRYRDGVPYGGQAQVVQTPNSEL